jgi:hypothetical protein
MKRQKRPSCQTRRIGKRKTQTNAGHFANEPDRESLLAFSPIFTGFPQLETPKMVEDNIAEITEQEAELYDRQIRLWGLESQKR